MAVAEIAEIAYNDDETAHALEKDLWRRVLAAIAAGAADAPALAAEALKTREVVFCRWYS